MKTSIIAIILGGIIAGAVIFALIIPTQNHHYIIEIKGMKGQYYIGEEYFFFYTISGFGDICGSWVATFPDQNGTTMYRGEAVDCTEKTADKISYDSRKDGRGLGSLVPTIPGKYNVTVTVEEIKEPVVHFFEVISNDHIQAVNACTELFNEIYEEFSTRESCESDTGATCEPELFENVIRSNQEFFKLNCGAELEHWAHLSKYNDEAWGSLGPLYEIKVSKYNPAGEPIHITLEKWGYKACNSFSAEVIDRNDNSVIWERKSTNSCVVLEPARWQSFSYPITVGGNQLVIDQPGQFMVKVYLDDDDLFDVQGYFDVTPKQNEKSYELDEPVCIGRDCEIESTIESGFAVKVSGAQQVRGGTTHDINVIVTRDGNPVDNAQIRITIEDYGEDILKEFKGRTDPNGRFVFSWEAPKFDDIKTLLAFIDATDDISVKTILFKFSVYCLPGEAGCKIDGN